MPNTTNSDGLRAVWTAEHRLHEPENEVWIGMPIKGDEVPARGEAMRAVLEVMGISPSAPEPHGLAPIIAIHDEAMVSYLESAYREWEIAGYPENPGQSRVVPYVFPHPDAVRMSARPWPASRAARAGVYCMDTTTVIGPGTYRAAIAAVDASLTAADIVLDGGRAAYAAVRPPGHHAGTTFFGGSCYLNNAAVAAQYLIDEGVEVVAIVDIDAHHGNGTQQIFYDRGDVLYLSIHIDPGEGWFPHFVGFSDENGSGPGAGANHNMLLAPGDGDDTFLAGVDRLCSIVVEAGADVVVVSLGLDMAAADENSPLLVSTRGFALAGEKLFELNRPTILVQEGGYDLASLESDLSAILTRFSSAGGADHGLYPAGGKR